MNDQALRTHLAKLLDGEGAHLPPVQTLAGFPRPHRAARVPGAPHTPWQLLEHMRIAQWDILEFSRDGAHRSPTFPEGYWPPADVPPDPAAWDASVARFASDLRAMKRLILDPASDVFAAIPHGEGQTLLREALLVADHNAYHLGQLVLLGKQLDAR